MDTGIRGKAALVTGGSSGIGRAIALALAAEGADVAIASRVPNDDVVEEIAAFGVRTAALQVDVSQEDQAVRLVERCREALGRLDLYVNNAAATSREAVTRIATGRWTHTLQTNLLAAMWTCREAAKHMVRRGDGSILIVGSTAQYNPAYGQSAYHVSKASLAAYARALSVELAPHGVRVNMIVPGSFRTRLNPLATKAEEERVLLDIPQQRIGTPRDCGPAAVFLLSDSLSPYTTGAELAITGGLHLRPFVRLDESDILDLNAPEGHER